MNAKDELLKSLFPQIINHFASLKNISLQESTDIFFKSTTYVKLCGDNDFYSKGIDYIVNELENEYLTFS
ncbi:hypothetical protein [Terrisporobacter mayombei]|uniref:DUF3791 domain-containing protein n=1 Tax=Terrisporobacter mayombei TaxID=1541 RepID=A0ABY9Q6F2_9FIRM|nr:hypothetical protein [Terrisporobacter mayombei]MCC3869081.1 hypothetical protein [Terrisporobacter mayombei]WMT82785.1 hypothetical protein TEMA_32770 [Terrisporobacter mayombei]